MGDCLFCKIANKEIKSDIIFEDENVIAFRDIAPQAPEHILVIPKKHLPSLIDVEGAQNIEYLNSIFLVVNKIAKDKNLDKGGFRVVINHGSDAGQAVPHLHVHILGGRKLNWPPG